VLFGFGRGFVGLIPDRGHRCEGQHDKRDMAMPSMPGTGLVVIEAQFVFCGFESVLDSPGIMAQSPQAISLNSSYISRHERNKNGDNFKVEAG
jgi:hypothetical protein